MRENPDGPSKVAGALFPVLPQPGTARQSFLEYVNVTPRLRETPAFSELAIITISMVGLKCGFDQNFFLALKINMQHKAESGKRGIQILDEIQGCTKTDFPVDKNILLGVLRYTRTFFFTA
ncbi:hypothetical protein IscW_ISCW010559 [Ixodes scapularis]|uniref:Uncharacterized protein n=1 Tax=Ixodes scapularis TaxID=6945 RepID=B7Q4Y9_IXOSC|nr:hypothetical protein IscW_ISCW010559 [Ixodes scapularis]|eukprot:XP_002401224.1 hypothetical protein IscW_ISCW010559 [Ixodes scapularis]